MSKLLSQSQTKQKIEIENRLRGATVLRLAAAGANDQEAAAYWRKRVVRLRSDLRKFSS